MFLFFNHISGCNAQGDKIVGGEEAIPHEFPWQVAIFSIYS